VIVQLTGKQRRAMLIYADDKLAAAIEAGSTQRYEGTKWWWVEMPAIAWRQVRDQLTPRLYGPQGGFRAPSAPLRRGLMSVQAELARLENHPALTRSSVVGFVHEDVPAWTTAAYYCSGVSTQWYTIYPNGGEFVVLTPHHSSVRGFDVTTWAPGLGRVDARTHQEVAHLAFHASEPA
jgi:hypothetical protein